MKHNTAIERGLIRSCENAIVSGYTFPLYLQKKGSYVSLNFMMTGYSTQQLILAVKQFLLSESASTTKRAFRTESYCRSHLSMCQGLSHHWQHFTSKVSWKITNCSNGTKRSSSQGYCWNEFKCFTRRMSQQLDISYIFIQKILMTIYC